MKLLSSTSVLRVTTGSAGAIDAYSSSMDVTLASGVVVPNPPFTVASITTATTTTISPTVSSGHICNVKDAVIFNTHASISNTILVELFDGTNAISVWNGPRAPGEFVILEEGGAWTTYSALGEVQAVGLPLTTAGDLVVFDTAPNRLAVGADMMVLTAAASAPQKLKWAFPVLTNRSVSNNTGFAADTYLVGSAIAMPAGGPVVGTKYHIVFDMVKTGAGTATPIINVRFGTAGSTADASILTFTFPAGTAVADTGVFELSLHFRTVGAGTAAVIVGIATLSHQLATTGLSASTAVGYGQITTVSSGFNSTPAGSILGISVNGGASFSGTNTIVETEAYNLSI